MNQFYVNLRLTNDSPTLFWRNIHPVHFTYLKWVGVGFAVTLQIILTVSCLPTYIPRTFFVEQNGVTEIKLKYYELNARQCF